MRSRVLNSLNELVPIFLYSIVVSILFRPWLYSLLRTFRHSGVIAFLPLWTILIIAFSALLGGWLETLDRSPRFFVLFLYIGINLLMLYLLGWPLFICTPSALVLTLFGLRFRLYFRTTDVKKDIALGVLILFFNLAVTSTLGYNIGFVEIVLFFLAAMGVGVFFNLKSLEIEGFEPQYRLGFGLLALSGLVVFVAAFLIGLPLEAGLLQVFVDAIHQIYLLFARFLLFVLSALLWVLRPLFNLLENLQLARPKQLPEQEEVARSLEDFTTHMSGAEGVKTPLAPYIFWGLLCLILVVFLVCVVRKFSSNYQQKQIQEGVVQQNESLFSLSELGSRAKNRWMSFQDRFSRYDFARLRDRYRSQDPLTRIRGTYLQLARNLNNFLPFQVSNTPRDYLERLQDQMELVGSSAEINELTEIYNRARYGNLAESEDARRAEELWGKISSKVKELEDKRAG